MVKIKRVHDPPLPDDGKRVLVDRLWPRGMKKTEAHFDEWLKDIAPSIERRVWYGHEPAKTVRIVLHKSAGLTPMTLQLKQRHGMT
jgi:uncharacterized protein YeaO (DUF488 family)